MFVKFDTNHLQILLVNKNGGFQIKQLQHCMRYFVSLEVVCLGSKIQLQVGENL